MRRALVPGGVARRQSGEVIRRPCRDLMTGRGEGEYLLLTGSHCGRYHCVVT